MYETYEHTISRLLKITCLFYKKPYKRNDILQKRPVIWKSLLEIWAYDRMRWLRLVGSLKLQVSFAEYHLFYRALL